MAGLSTADADLAYQYLPTAVRADIEADAHSRVLDEWRDSRPSDLDTLETAHDDPDSPFAWDTIDVTAEQSQVDGSDELTPHTYTGDASDTVHELARDVAWDYVAAIREQIEAMQSETMLSPREFVALILDAEWDERNAATLMGVSVGNYRGKKGEIAAKLATAETTLSLADRIRDE